MTSYTIRKEWYEDIKNRVEHANEYEYNNMIEVDVNENEFIEVSKELGWML